MGEAYKSFKLSRWFFSLLVFTSSLSLTWSSQLRSVFCPMCVCVEIHLSDVMKTDQSARLKSLILKQCNRCYGRKWRGTKMPLDESERGEWKSWLKPQYSENEDHGIRSHHTSWQIDGETVETLSDFVFLGSKFTADGDYSHEIKRYLLLWKKVITTLDSIFKSRDYFAD